MSENQIQISFKNYKLLENLDVELENGSIFFIQAGNNRGKTTLLQGIRSLMEMNDSTKDPVTHNEKEGYIIGKIPGADGKIYTVRYDFNIDGKKKFQVIGPDNKSIKNVGDMRAVFNYTHFTIEDFFMWGTNADGRKKQKEIILKLLPESDQNRITTIDALINPSTGTEVDKRKNINKKIDATQLLIDTYKVSPDDLIILENEKKIPELLEKLNADKIEIEEYLKNNTTENLDSKKNLLDTAISEHESKLTEFNNDIKELDDEIEELKKKLQEKQEKRNKKADDKKSYDELQLDLIKKYGKEVEDLQKTINVTTIQEKKTALDSVIERINTGNSKKTKLDDLLNKRKENDERKKELDKLKKEADSITEQIESYRKEKNSIITSSNSIPAGLSFDDDMLLYNGIPLLQSDISKSSATKAIAELMLKVNPSPILLMGDAETLGFEVLDHLKAKAEESGHIMVFAEQIRTKKDIEVICYDDMEREESSEQSNTLF